MTWAELLTFVVLDPNYEHSNLAEEELSGDGIMSGPVLLRARAAGGAVHGREMVTARGWTASKKR